MIYRKPLLWLMLSHEQYSLTGQHWYDYANGNPSHSSLLFTVEDTDNKGNYFAAKLNLQLILKLGFALCSFLSLKQVDT
jgi:hypothetical protein